MLITAFFTDSGVPKTGLFPTINAWRSDGTLVINKQAMLERAGGFYDYDFVDYSNAENYTFVADGGSSLFGYDRYVYATNDVASLMIDVGKLEKLIKQSGQFSLISMLNN